MAKKIFYATIIGMAAMMITTVAIVCEGVIPFNEVLWIPVWVKQCVLIAIASTITLIPLSGKWGRKIVFSTLLMMISSAVWLQTQDRLRWQILAIFISNVLIAYATRLFFYKKGEKRKNHLPTEWTLGALITAPCIHWVAEWLTSSEIASAVITAVSISMLLCCSVAFPFKTGIASMVTVVGAISNALLPNKTIWIVLVAIVQVGLYLTIAQKIVRKKKVTVAPALVQLIPEMEEIAPADCNFDWQEWECMKRLMKKFEPRER